MRPHERPDLDLSLRPDASGAPVGSGCPQALDQTTVARREKAKAIFPHAGFAEELFDVGEKLRCHGSALCTL